MIAPHEASEPDSLMGCLACSAAWPPDDERWTLSDNLKGDDDERAD